MLPGPVFTFELLTTARRGRFYLARAFYAVVLFIILWTVHSAWTTEHGGELPLQYIKWFAFSTFCGITVGQEVMVLALTPALVAGVIADEKQRKTLHYLMASQLTSLEIVVGKLLVRMLYLAVLLGVSLPILSLLVLLGGIDPRLVLLACAATFSTAWFLSALSIWVSTIARRPREALFIAFGLECLWLFLPLMARTARTPGSPVVDQMLSWLGEWVGTSSPAEVIRQIFWGAVRGGGSSQTEIELVCWMSGLQAVFGLVLAILAAMQLRPIFRHQEGGGVVRHRRGLRSIWRSTPLTRRPVVGDRPMLWKELYTGGTRGFAWLISFLLTAIGGGFLAYYTVWMGAAAILEWCDQGYVSWVGYQHSDRIQFYWYMLFIVPLLYLVGILSVAGSAAAAITSEHEGDTWVSLTATDLTAREVVFAKLLGALKRGRLLAELILLMVATGIVAGSLHVLSVPALILALLIYGWFAAALGVWISVQLRSTWRAQFLTIALLLLINVTGQGVLNTIATRGFAPVLWPGFTPYEISKLVFNPQIVRSLAEASWPQSWFWHLRNIDDGVAWQAIFSVLSLFGYLSLAMLLTWDALRRFEMVAGRARRS